MTAACVFLSESIGKGKAAKSLGISSQTLKKYLGFAAVPDKLKQFVPKEISRDDSVKLYQAVTEYFKSSKDCRENNSVGSKTKKSISKVSCTFTKVFSS